MPWREARFNRAPAPQMKASRSRAVREREDARNSIHNLYQSATRRPSSSEQRRWMAPAHEPDPDMFRTQRLAAESGLTVGQGTSRFRIRNSVPAAALMQRGGGHRVCRTGAHACSLVS